MTENLLFDDSIKKIEFTFRCMGINIRSGERKDMTTLKSRCVYILNFVWLNTDLAGAIFWFVIGLNQGKSLIELTYVAPCITLSFLGNFKTLFLIIYEKNVHQLIDNLRAMEIRENIRKKTECTSEIIQTERRFLNIVLNMFNGLNGALIVTFALSPLILMLLSYLKTNEIEFILPFLIVYPFNAYDIKYWPVVYLRQIWSEVIVVLDVCAGDYLFYTFCTYIRMHFRLLQHSIEEIIPAQDNLSKKITYDEQFRSKFIEIIKQHQDLISSANLLEKIYAKSTLYNFVSSSIIICLTGFNVTAINDIALVVTFLSFLFMSLLQIFFLCFFGDMLMRSSMEVSDAVYKCNWYYADPTVGKHLLLVQTRHVFMTFEVEYFLVLCILCGPYPRFSSEPEVTAQKPCRLTAFGFADVNLRAFTKILSTSWSYFALLETLYSSGHE